MIDNRIIKDARIAPGRFRNFTGERRNFNDEGDRNFTLFLDNNTADQLRADGWNVRVLAPRDADDDEQPILRVKVNFAGKYPPRVVMVNHGKKTPLTEETIGLLDTAEIEKADICIHPYEWHNARGESGVSAYLKTLYVTIRDDDEFAEDYPDPADEDAPW